MRYLLLLSIATLLFFTGCQKPRNPQVCDNSINRAGEITKEQAGEIAQRAFPGGKINGQKIHHADVSVDRDAVGWSVLITWIHADEHGKTIYYPGAHVMVFIDRHGNILRHVPGQ